MLDILIGGGPTEAAAGSELERAFEDKAIRLFAPAGSGADGEQLWREISNEETSALIALLRDLCNRAPTTTIGTFNLPIGLFKTARAIRSQFELAFGLRTVEEEVSPPLSRRFATDEQLVAEAIAGIRAGRWPNAHQAALDLEALRCSIASPRKPVPGGILTCWRRPDAANDGAPQGAPKGDGFKSNPFLRLCCFTEADIQFPSSRRDSRYCAAQLAGDSSRTCPRERQLP
jgi:hypothetical protein